MDKSDNGKDIILFLKQMDKNEFAHRVWMMAEEIVQLKRDLDYEKQRISELEAKNKDLVQISIQQITEISDRGIIIKALTRQLDKQGKMIEKLKSVARHSPFCPVEENVFECYCGLAEVLQSAAELREGM